MLRIFNLNNLNSIQQYDRYRNYVSPFIVHNSHSKFHTKGAISSQLFMPLKFFHFWQSGIDLSGIVTIGRCKILKFVSFWIKRWLFDRQILKILGESILNQIFLCYLWSLLNFACQIEMLIVFNVLKFLFRLEFLELGGMSPHE